MGDGRLLRARLSSIHTTPFCSVALLVCSLCMFLDRLYGKETGLIQNDIGSMYMMGRMVLGHKTWFGKG